LRKVKDIYPKHRQNFRIVKNKRVAVQDSHFSFLTGDPALERRPMVRRRITPEDGRGLEKLGHALEYLADEFVRDGCEVVEDYGRLMAIQLLASLNRQIYFACGVQPTMRDRVQSLVQRFLTNPSCPPDQSPHSK
jgi:hypothetical protein